MAIEITRKNASIDIKMFDGSVRTLRFDPLSITLYRHLIALSEMTDEYADFFESFNRDAETLPIRAQMAKLAEAATLASRLASEFDSTMAVAFGEEWTEVKGANGTIDNTEVIADVIKDMMSQIAQAKAKSDVMHAANV